MNDIRHMPVYVISNKDYIAPLKPKSEPEYIKDFGWRNGYSFRQFLGNVYEHLGGLANIEGIQQLVHQYYLQNGSLNARTTAERIKRFIG